MPMLGHGCLKLRPLCMDTFKVVNCLEESNKEHAISFEFRKRPGWFIRARKQGCFIEKRLSDSNFEKDCSFYPMVNLWFQDYVVFQSASKAAHYLRMKDGRMTLAHYDASSIFKEEASFRLAKKREKTSIIEETGNNDSELKCTCPDEIVGENVPFGSPCLCSRCVSQVSLQIYEENSPKFQRYEY